ncbi:MAG: RNA polymerase sigma factor [Bacteroidota bacterium]|nr:RNA polymerase sigma factor [Bacteroidota bacterium]
MKYTQEDIIKGCFREEREYQKALYETYSSKMFAICLRYLSNREDAEDMLQDTFIKIFSAPKYFENISNLDAWIRKVFVNNILTHFKSKKKIFASYEVENIAEQEDFVFDVDTEKFTTKELLQALFSLKKEERIIFNMLELEDLSYKEVESITKRNASTIRSINMRAKIKMKNFLNQIKKQ